MSGRARIAFHSGLATAAAAAALMAVFDGYGWLFPVLGGVLVVMAVSELVRVSPLPAALGPILAAAGVLVYITAVYAGSTAYWHVIPSRSSFHGLATIARAGFHDIHTLGTPVPPHRGLVLLAVVGIAAVGLVVDLLAVTMRRAALAGLPLLATFALCTSVSKSGVGWVPFAIGAAGYLWLLLADSRDRFARWGRPAERPDPTRPRFSWSDTDVMPSPLAVMGRRIGVSAIAVAVVLPLAIPGLHGGLPRGGHGFGFGTGSSTRFTVNPIVTISGDLKSVRSRQVLSVRTSDPDPGYLRLTALERFDGNTFSPATLQQPPAAEVANGIPVTPLPGTLRSASIAVGAFNVPWLPLPAQVTSVDVSGDWRFDPATNTVFSARDSTAGLQYSVQFVRPEPTVAQLERASTDDPSVDADRQLPPIPAEVRQLTESVVAKAKTPFDRALAIQRFLTGPSFSYDVHVDTGSGTNALADFLLRTRSGFCQQYAAAMAVMARIVGIPSRVAVGFTRGEIQPDHSWLITTHDAHAWPELYFTGYGWLPFEPTPRGDGQAQLPAYTVPTAPDKSGADGNNGKTNSNGGSNKPGSQLTKNQRLDQLADSRGGLGPSANTGTGSHTRGDVILAVLALVVVGLVVPSVVRVVQRRRRWRRAVTVTERAAAAWAELRATAIDAHADWIDGLSPRATARALRADAGGFDAAAVAALDRVVATVQRAWYARPTDTSADPGLHTDVTTVARALFAVTGPGRRLVRRTWPRSVLRDTRAAIGRTVAVLDAVDLAAARLRARLRPQHALSG